MFVNFMFLGQVLLMDDCRIVEQQASIHDPCATNKVLHFQTYLCGSFSNRHLYSEAPSRTPVSSSRTRYFEYPLRILDPYIAYNI